ILKNIRDHNNTSSIPYFFENLGMLPDIIEKAIRGMVVINPAAVVESDNALLISSTTGPTEVKGALKLDAIKITPRSSIKELESSLQGKLTVLFSFLTFWVY